MKTKVEMADNSLCQQPIIETSSAITVFACTIHMVRNVDFLKKLSAKNKLNINTTLLLIDDEKRSKPRSEELPLINTYANLDWKGFPIVILRGGTNGALFFAGFPADIGSGKFFTDNQSLFSSKIQIMRNIGKWRKKEKLHKNTHFWGDFTEAAMIEKLKEVYKRRQEPSADFSDTSYYDIEGNLKKLQYKKYTSPAYLNYLNNKLPIIDGELRHNECHVAASPYHVDCICLTEEDLLSETREVGSYSESIKGFLNSRYITFALAQKLQKQLNEQRSALLVALQQPPINVSNSIILAMRPRVQKEIEHCIDLEFSKVCLVFEKIFLFAKEKNYHETHPNLASNELIELSFRSKKHKDPNFNDKDPRNELIWLESQQIYLQKEFYNLYSELTKLEQEYDFQNLHEIANQIKAIDFNSLNAQKSASTIIANWKEVAKSNSTLKNAVISKITQNLQQPLAIKIYNKQSRKIEDLPSGLENELSKSENLEKDPHILRQLLNNHLTDYDADPKIKSIFHSKLASTTSEKLGQLVLTCVGSNNLNGLTLLISGFSEKIDFLKTRIADGEFQGSNALHIAATNGNIQIVEKLLATVPEAQKLELIRSTISEGSFKGLSALHIAATNGNIQIVEKLLATVPEAQKSNFLRTKATEGKFKGLNALHIAATNGNIQIFERLFVAIPEAQRLELIRSTISEGSFKGLNALHIAATNGNMRIFEILLASIHERQRLKFIKKRISDGKNKGLNTIQLLASSPHDQDAAITIKKILTNIPQSERQNFINNKHRFSFFKSDRYSISSFHIAAQHGNFASMKAILENSALTDKEREKMIEKKYRPFSDGSSTAPKKPLQSTISSLLEPNLDSRRIRCFAKTINLLLENGANVESNHASSLDLLKENLVNQVSKDQIISLQTKLTNHYKAQKFLSELFAEKSKIFNFFYKKRSPQEIELIMRKAESNIKISTPPISGRQEELSALSESGLRSFFNQCDNVPNSRLKLKITILKNPRELQTTGTQESEEISIELDKFGAKKLFSSYLEMAKIFATNRLMTGYNISSALVFIDETRRNDSVGAPMNNSDLNINTKPVSVGNELTIRNNNSTSPMPNPDLQTESIAVSVFQKIAKTVSSH